MILIYTGTPHKPILNVPRSGLPVGGRRSVDAWMPRSVAHSSRSSSSPVTSPALSLVSLSLSPLFCATMNKLLKLAFKPADYLLNWPVSVGRCVLS